MGSCYKDSVSTDPVHVDACTGLYVIEMNVAIFCDQIDHIILRSNLEIKANVAIHYREMINYGSAGVTCSCSTGDKNATK